MDINFQGQITDVISKNPIFLIFVYPLFINI